jgi:hypothetical protein
MGVVQEIDGSKLPQPRRPIRVVEGSGIIRVVSDPHNGDWTWEKHQAPDQPGEHHARSNPRKFPPSRGPYGLLWLRRGVPNSIVHNVRSLIVRVIEPAHRRYAGRDGVSSEGTMRRPRRSIRMVVAIVLVSAVDLATARYLIRLLKGHAGLWSLAGLNLLCVLVMASILVVYAFVVLRDLRRRGQVSPFLVGFEVSG